jgi:uncharacterized membrane protein
MLVIRTTDDVRKAIQGGMAAESVVADVPIVPGVWRSQRWKRWRGWRVMTWIEAVDEDVTLSRFLEVFVKSAGKEDICEF